MKNSLLGFTSILQKLRLNHPLKDVNITTVYAKRNAHLILNFFVTSLGEGGQKCTWSIM